MEVKAGNDIFKFAERYGDRLMFVGGLDARILESNDRARIRQGVINFMTGLKQRGAQFVYGSDHSLSRRRIGRPQSPFVSRLSTKHSTFGGQPSAVG